MAEVPQAYIAHQMPGRLRLRIPHWRDDLQSFERVGEQARKIAGVEKVEVNPSTGSVLILAPDTSAAVDELVTKGLLTLVERPSLVKTSERASAESLVQRGRLALQLADREIARLTNGRENLQSLVLAGLLGGGIIQLARGKVLAPASTLLWYAGGLMRLWYDDPVARVRH
jgi:hypothetical protein